jgi:hypothetical protein
MGLGSTVRLAAALLAPAMLIFAALVPSPCPIQITWTTRGGSCAPSLTVPDGKPHSLRLIRRRETAR